MLFEFATATRILFGSGTVKEVAPIAAEWGRIVFVVTGSSGRRAEPLVKQLKEKDLESTVFNVSGEPTTKVVLAGVEQARDAKCDVVIGIGGGSVLDTGKAVAALLTNTGELTDYLEVIGKGQPLSKAPAPYIAIPTTAGTGTEVTRNSVIASPEHRVKVSLRSSLMLPRLSVIDPLLTYSMTPALTASTGLDALTQLIEPFVSNKPNPLVDTICREGIKLVARSLRKAYDEGDNAGARENMSLASLFSGLALANAKLGAVHGIAGPLGGMFPAPHGVVCARLLPYVMEANVQALKTRTADSPALGRYEEVARILMSNSTAEASDGITLVKEFVADFAIPSLSKFGLSEDDFPALVVKAKKASSMKGNPVELTDKEFVGILKKSV